MILKIKNCFVVLFCFLSVFVLSQNQYSKWYFGNFAALDFMTSPPIPLFNSVMNTSEAASTASDGSGNLLFYTSGVTVWNRQHVIMANGNGLMGHHSSAQGALIVKQPGNTNIYYIFTIDQVAGTNGLRYSTVDMNLAAGMGSVTVKNTLLVTPSTERLCGIRHCNGTDVWVVTHDYPGNNYRSYLVSSAGVNNTPVLSPVGSAYTFSSTSLGIMTASPSGKKIGTGYNDSLTAYFELLDFDNTTGIVSNPLQINLPIADGEFSTDGSKLYGTINASVFCQLDLCAGSAAAIAATAYTASCPLMMRLQKAIDGKIYVQNIIGNTFFTIHNPNSSGAACNFVNSGVSVAPGMNLFSLPNFVNERIATPFSFTNTPAGCNTASFSIPNCPLLNNTFTSVFWNFGDQSSGINNTSTLADPVHVYPGPGTYTVRVIYYYSCTTDTTEQAVTIGATPLVVSSHYMCKGDSAILTATGNVSYTWSTTQTTSTISVSPTVTTVYTVSGTGVTGCTNVATSTVVVFQPPVLSVSGNSAVCIGKNATFTASGASNYTWSTGFQSPVLNILQPANTTYTLYGAHAFGCVSQKTFSVAVIPLPTITVAGSTTLCPGSSETYTATGANTYSWSSGLTGSVVVLSPTVNTNYILKGSDSYGCVSQTTVQLSLVTKPPTTDFSYDSVCVYVEGTSPKKKNGFNVGGAFSSQGLDINSTTGEIKPLPSAGDYLINYSVPASGCFSSGSGIAILSVLPVVPLSVGPDRNIAPGSNATLQVSGGVSYTWSPADYLSCVNCSAPVVASPYPMSYCVASIVEGCRSEACLEIKVSCEAGNDFSLPNAFSPNADGINDVFCLQGWDQCITDFEIMIFNRWGEMVYTSGSRSFCWDGYYKGELLIADVLVYTLKATFNNQTRINKKGNISLLR